MTRKEEEYRCTSCDYHFKASPPEQTAPACPKCRDSEYVVGFMQVEINYGYPSN